MARSARRAGRQPAAKTGRRARAGSAIALLGTVVLLGAFPLAGVADAAADPGADPVPIASSGQWAPLVTLAIVTAVFGLVMFWRSRRGSRTPRA
ncbi:MAG TPA: hypothetical protein VIH82_11880 [Acidimicrobiia bacterium]|jgi:hypothetical protein